MSDSFSLPNRNTLLGSGQEWGLGLVFRGQDNSGRKECVLDLRFVYRTFKVADEAADSSVMLTALCVDINDPPDNDRHYLHMGPSGHYTDLCSGACREELV